MVDTLTPSQPSLNGKASVVREEKKTQPRHRFPIVEKILHNPLTSGFVAGSVVCGIVTILDSVARQQLSYEALIFTVIFLIAALAFKLKKPGNEEKDCNFCKQAEAFSPRV